MCARYIPTVSFINDHLLIMVRSDASETDIITVTSHGRRGILHHRKIDLFNSLASLTRMEIWKLALLVVCEGKPPVTDGHEFIFLIPNPDQLWGIFENAKRKNTLSHNGGRDKLENNFLNENCCIWFQFDWRIFPHFQLTLRHFWF